MALTTSPFGFPYPEDTDLVRDGAQDIENLAEGVNDQLELGYLYVGTRYYTSSGTFAKADPFGDSSFDGTKMRAIRVRMVGGGGGSAGIQNATAGNGSIGSSASGGNYAESFITDIAGLDASVTVTRGAGGAAGTAGANNGGSGGNSSFGSLVVAQGGNPGNNRATGTSVSIGGRAPASIAGDTGDIKMAGGGGRPSFVLTGGASLGAIGGAGGASLLGQSGPDASSGANFSNGTAGQLYGGGGGGPCALNLQGDQAGSAGESGIVIVDVFA